MNTEDDLSKAMIGDAKTAADFGGTYSTSGYIYTTPTYDIEAKKAALEAAQNFAFNKEQPPSIQEFLRDATEIYNWLKVDVHVNGSTEDGL